MNLHVREATWSELEDRKPMYALVANVDLVIVRCDDQVSVLYGRCQHRGALMSDGRGGATGAAPNIFKNNISVPTIPALGRARRHLDRGKRSDVTLIITGGLRTESDFLKALALGGRHCDCEQRDTGNRVSWHACLPYEQLSGWHRNAKRKLAIATRR